MLLGYVKLDDVCYFITTEDTSVFATPSYTAEDCDEEDELPMIVVAEISNNFRVLMVGSRAEN